jgi:hypothetical protein
VGELARMIERAGFDDVEFRTLTMGIAAVHWGSRAAGAALSPTDLSSIHPARSA